MHCVHDELDTGRYTDSTSHVHCRLLLDNGARPDHKYFMGYEINLVPLDHLECLKTLLEYGADPNVFNR